MKKQSVTIINSLTFGVLGDLAKANGFTRSLVAESIITQELYMNVIPVIWNVLMRDMYDQKLSIGQTLTAIWREPDRLTCMHLKGVVEYAAKETVLCNKLPDPNCEEWPHFIGILGSVSRILSSTVDKSSSSDLKKDAERLAEITEAYRDNDVRIGLEEVYRIILKYWDAELNPEKRTIVYNLLQSLSTVQTGWRDLPCDRLALMHELRKTWGIVEPEASE